MNRAYLNGYVAGDLEDDISTCPFSDTDELRQDWLSGYHDAINDRKLEEEERRKLTGGLDGSLGPV